MTDPVESLARSIAETAHEGQVDVPHCPWCRSTALIVRGTMSDFTRYRCRKCMAEFDVDEEAADV